MGAGFTRSFKASLVFCPMKQSPSTHEAPGNSAEILNASILMTDIKSPRLLYLKGALMLLTGILAGSLVISQAPSLWTVLLLSIAIWGFCRAYYFAFYVIEHYVDPSYKFSGLIDFFRYCLGLHPPSTSEPIDRPAEH